jgi:hypothetical protein
VKRLMLVGLLGGMLASSTGCCLLQEACGNRPCGGRGGCDQGICNSCDDGCCPTCGAMHRPIRAPAYAVRRAAAWDDGDDGCEAGCGRPCRRACGRSCGPTCDSCGGCDPCADPCGGGCAERCWYRGPLSCLFALFGRGIWCGPNCGERYWGDFYSDPPDCQDPCDCQGNYAGGCRSCGGGSHDGAAYHEGGGCKNCGRSAAHGRLATQADDGQPMADENIVSQNDRLVPTPKLATPEPHRATRP